MLNDFRALQVALDDVGLLLERSTKLAELFARFLECIVRALQVTRAQLELFDLASELQLGNDLPGQRVQRLRLLPSNVACFTVNHT